MPRNLPTFFSQLEIDRLLSAPTITGPQSLRDRAILELFVASGLRASELLALRPCDLGDGTVFVQRGKGGKQRYVPLSTRALSAVLAYLQQHPCPSESPIFRNAWGKPLSRRGLHKVVTAHIHAASLKGHLHKMRHTFATRVLNRGMGVDRQLQPRGSDAVIPST